jgi:hypothetical protein
MTGGGGEGGYATRTPELMLSGAIRGGVTTVVGCLGTDGVTRSLAGLLAKARGLDEEGISAFMYTGHYSVPVHTLTGSIERDLLFIDKVIGVGEVALSVVLVVGSGLLLQSFVRIVSTDAGFERDGIATARVSLSPSRYRSRGAQTAFFADVLERLRSLPEVSQAGLASTPPLQSGREVFFRTEGQAGDGDVRLAKVAASSAVDSDYFKVMGIPLKRGRLLADADAPGTELAVVVDETLARRYWPGEDPVGKRLREGYGGTTQPWMRVVGVVGAAVYWVLEARADRVYSLGAAGEADKLVVSELFKFTRSYWFIAGLCLVFYSAVFPFRTFAIKFFMEGHGATRELGGFLNSVLPLSAMVATPLFGLLVDRVGQRALFMLAGSALIVPAFVLLVPGLGLTPSLYLPIALLGIAFSLIPAVMWPSVTYVVAQNRLGTAYALMTLIQQVGVLAMNWGIGAANDAAGAGAANPAGYGPGMWLLSTLGVAGVVFALLLRRAETGPGAHGLETITLKNPKA